MSKIIVSSDSTIDLGDELLQRYNIKILPLGIVLGDKLYIDGIDITPDDIYAHHDKTGELPKTNASNVEDCINFFRSFVDAGNTVIHFTISGEMSSNNNNARIAAEEVGNVYVIDSRNLSTGGGLLVLAAAKLAESGLPAEEIVERINALVPKTDASFVIDSLEYLHKGGRCSAVAMLGANLLKLKPCIQVKDGKMDVRKKFRGKFDTVIREYIDEQLENRDDIDVECGFITHAGCDPQLVDSLFEYVKAKGIFKELYVTRAGSTVSSHCGANTLGILFIRKTPLA